MSSEDERVAWLREQIEARKRIASVLVLEPSEPWRSDGGAWDAGTGILSDSGRPVAVAIGDYAAWHIVANDPQDTIARCESELALLDWAGKIFAEHGWREPDLHSWDSELAAINGARFVRRQIASAYRNRDGYAEHWEKPAQA